MKCVVTNNLRCPAHPSRVAVLLSLRRWAITSWPPARPRPKVGASAAAQIGTGAGQASAAGMQAYESTLDGVRKIVRQEGVMALWRGTSASLLMVRAAMYPQPHIYSACTTAHTTAAQSMQ